MCFHKSFAKSEQDLLDHYSASFQTIKEDLEIIKEKFLTLARKDEKLSSLTIGGSNELHNLLLEYSQKDALPDCFTRQELTELKWQLKTLSAFHDAGLYRYHENGFDYLSMPIITAGDPQNFKMFKWGLIPFYMTDKEKAMTLRTQTLNCISEEMYEKPSFKDAAKNAQRCLIPVTGFFEWRWLDEQGTVKIPYYITFRDQKIRSMAGLYSRWKDKETGDYYYSYTVLTTKANNILEYVHNHKKRMPVFIDKQNEQAWLNRDLSKDDVMDLCQPSQDEAMRAYTISKLLTTRNTLTNIPKVLEPMNYQAAIEEAQTFLNRGDKRRALDIFKNAVTGEKIKIEDLAQVTPQQIKAEITFAPSLT